MSKPKAKYDFVARKNEWLGVIYRQRKDGITVLTIGTEDTEEEINRWCLLALKNEPWKPGGKPAPDKYDRAKNKTKLH